MGTDRVHRWTSCTSKRMCSHSPNRREPVVEPRSEEQIRKDLERLELIKKKRCGQDVSPSAC